MFVWYQYERLNVVQASDTWSPKTYEKGNHTLFVYHSPYTQRLRTTPNFDFRANNVAGELEQGSLFWLSDPTQYEKTKRNDNFPKDNVRRYNFFQVETFLNGKHESLVALSIFRSYLMDEDEDFINVRPILDKGYLFLRSSPLVDWIYWTLKENGWNGRDSFKLGDFSYVDGGFYGTTLVQDVDLYNRRGEKIGRLETGSRVFATWDLPFTTGYNNPSLIRIVGYSRDNSAERVEKVGTFFVEGLKDNQRTISTIPVTK
ncbi:hypothetical protein [Paenibacillus turpanensis]|uniref:hypothetical protein n=1 Tax=Paenibacillus turpanensis TaxID=2689078 RepID=UPI001409F55C|nr:hypothetical protein [Paenibacillus turpanensis]